MFDKSIQVNWKIYKFNRQFDASRYGYNNNNFNSMMNFAGGYGNPIPPVSSSSQAPPTTFQIPTTTQVFTHPPVQTTSQPEILINGITFDCTNKPTGPNKDTRYCDIFHACVYGQQQKTYGCPQNGGRFYYDENTKK
jgi:hypothetical protein